jgi:Planctomycete cytochrome C
MRIQIATFGITLITVLFLVCCGKTETKPSGIVCTSSLPDSISFRRDVLPVLTKCSLPACHSGGDPKGHLNLEAASAFSQLRQPGSGYLNAIKPESSILYLTLTNDSRPMPPSGQLPDCEIALLRKWMVQGSLDN